MSAATNDPKALAERVFDSPSAPAPLVRGPSLAGAMGSFLVYGDTRSDPATHKRIVALMANEPGVAFVCHTGDIVGDGSDLRLWSGLLGIIQPLTARMPFYPVLGNHDLPRETALQALSHLQGIPHQLAGQGYYYGIDCGPVALAFLDSESLIKGDPGQLNWLRSYLGQSRAPLKVMLLHRPLWSPGPNGGSSTLRKQLMPIARECGVRLIFAAHDHMYYRSVREGVVEIITAGGGAPLYDVKDRSVIQQGDVLNKCHHYVRVDLASDRCVINAVDMQGQLIDQFSLPIR
jgi:hypothetical protein